MKKGAPWELRNALWLEQLSQAGLAWGTHCHPGVKMVRGRLIYDSKGPPDFMGITCTGQAFAFDCKHEEGTRLSFSAIPMHQAQALDRVLALGGLAFISAELGREQRVIPWCGLRERWWAWYRDQPGRASISLSDPLCLPMGEYGWWEQRHRLGKEVT